MAAGRLVVDVGGEGRHPIAWNVNPSPIRTLGRYKGQPIPRWLYGTAESIPLADGAVDWLIVERTPLSLAALKELARVVSPTGRITLRHVPLPWKDRHGLAKSVLPGRFVERMSCIGGLTVQETEFLLAHSLE